MGKNISTKKNLIRGKKESDYGLKGANFRKKRAVWENMKFSDRRRRRNSSGFLKLQSCNTALAHR